MIHGNDICDSVLRVPWLSRLECHCCVCYPKFIVGSCIYFWGHVMKTRILEPPNSCHQWSREYGLLTMKEVLHLIEPFFYVYEKVGCIHYQFPGA